MKVVILAGGLGTRLSEETVIRPKPMIEIGGKPLLWHIMKIYSYHGFHDFVICLGYKGYIIKEYFSNYFLHTSDVTINVKNNSMEIHQKYAEPWRVTLVDTGDETQTGGRIKRVAVYLNKKTFLVTYGDGVANIDISRLVKYHKSHGKLATITAVQPSGRFGALKIDKDNNVTAFQEKLVDNTSWINGGFFVLEPEIVDYITDDNTIFEKKPLEELASNGEIVAYKHKGFWQPMDTLREKNYLEDLWKTSKAPWKVWK